MDVVLPSGTPAFVCEPSDGSEPVRGVVILPDIHGLRPLFADLCQRLADENDWAVCAIEPWPGRESMPLEERLESVGSVEDSRLLGDAGAAADLLGLDHVAVIGFCMGGMYALKAAGTGRFDRSVAFYGMVRVPDHWRGADSGEPLAAMASGDVCPVLGIFGTQDPWTPSADIDALEAAGATVVRYEGAEHGFVHDASRPAHRADDAADAWRRTVSWLEV